MSRPIYDPATGAQQVGLELGVSDWITIDQERVNEFADCTGDRQWIHVDVERAQRHSPFGTTIAHGFLTLALLASEQMGLEIAHGGLAQVLNYGLDKVRFLTPVRVGARIRNRVVLLAVEPREEGRQLVKFQNTVEIEGEKKPALVAESLVLVLPS